MKLIDLNNLISTWASRNDFYRHAYIVRNKKGIFIHFKFESKDNAVKNIEEKLSIENKVIRYLTVKYNKLDLKKEYFTETK